MENKPILKVYTTDVDLLNYTSYQRVNTIEESDVVFIGGAGTPSSFLFQFEPLETGYRSNRNVDLLDIKTVMRAITLHKPIIGFARGHLLLSILSGDCDIFYCNRLPSVRRVEMLDKNLYFRNDRFLIPVPRRGASSYLLARSSDVRPDFYQKSKDHDRIDARSFRKGETEALLHARLSALSFAFEIDGVSQFAFVKTLIDKFMEREYSDLVTKYQPNDLVITPQNTTNNYIPSTTNNYIDSPFSASFIEEAIRSLGMDMDMDREQQIN